jgi:hypothetical protein
LELLGVYGVAMTFADLPRNVTNALSGKVIFPLFPESLTFLVKKFAPSSCTTASLSCSP